jgi:hypothetical protein
MKRERLSMLLVDDCDKLLPWLLARETTGELTPYAGDLMVQAGDLMEYPGDFRELL